MAPNKQPEENGWDWRPATFSRHRTRDLSGMSRLSLAGCFHESSVTAEEVVTHRDELPLAVLRAWISILVQCLHMCCSLSGGTFCPSLGRFYVVITSSFRKPSFWPSSILPGGVGVKPSQPGSKSFCFPLYPKGKGLKELLPCLLLRDNSIPFLTLSFSHIFLCSLVGDRSGQNWESEQSLERSAFLFSPWPPTTYCILSPLPPSSYPHLSHSTYNLDKSLRVEPSLIHFCMPCLCIVNTVFVYYGLKNYLLWGLSHAL